MPLIQQPSNIPCPAVIKAKKHKGARKHTPILSSKSGRSKFDEYSCLFRSSVDTNELSKKALMRLAKAKLTRKIQAAMRTKDVQAEPLQLARKKPRKGNPLIGALPSLNLTSHQWKPITSVPRVKHLHTASMFLQGGSPGLGK